MDKSSLKKHIVESTFLTSDQLDLALSYFQPANYHRNEMLVSDGQVSQYLNFVVKGCLRIFFIKEDGQEATRHLAFEKQFATGIASFITQKPAFEYLQSMEDTELLRITYKDFHYLLNVIPAWEKFYRSYLENAYIDNVQVFQREITKDAELRYKELLQRDPKAVMRLSNKVVASYLNMSPETLSRIKSRP